MSNELKIGILAAIAIAVTIWGYKFMKGKNLLKSSNILYVEYENVDQLTASSPIFIRGLRVGTVESVKLEDDMQTVLAVLDIDKGIRIPKNAVAEVVSTSIMGGRAIDINFDEPCTGNDCADEGDYIRGRVRGTMESVLGTDNIKGLFEDLKEGLGGLAKAVGDSLTAPGADSELAKSVKNLTSTLSNIESITAQLDNSLGNYDRRMLAIMQNVEVVSNGLATSTPQLQETLNNLNSISEDLAEADLKKTLSSANRMMENAGSAVDSLQATLSSATQAVDHLATLLAKIESDDGTIGQVLNSTELYDQVLLATTNLQLLLQDFRLNPKRYVNVSFFGKKQKEYVVPGDDPAYEENQ